MVSRVNAPNRKSDHVTDSPTPILDSVISDLRLPLLKDGQAFFALADLVLPNLVTTSNKHRQNLEKLATLDSPTFAEIVLNVHFRYHCRLTAKSYCNTNGLPLSWFEAFMKSEAYLKPKRSVLDARVEPNRYLDVYRKYSDKGLYGRAKYSMDDYLQGLVVFGYARQVSLGKIRTAFELATKTEKHLLSATAERESPLKFLSLLAEIEDQQLALFEELEAERRKEVEAERKLASAKYAEYFREQDRKEAAKPTFCAICATAPCEYGGRHFDNR